MDDEKNFFNCLSAAVGFKPNQLRKVLPENKSRNQNSKLP